MATEDLTAPLGRELKKRRRTIKIPVPQIITGLLVAFFGIFVLWAVVTDDPFGGEPMAVVPANIQVTAKPSNSGGAPSPAVAADADQSHGGQAAAPAGTAPPAPPAPATTTITIIDGKTGAKQEVQVPVPANAATAPSAATLPSAQSAAAPIDQKFVEMTPQGPIPKIAADGTRPAEAFARPVQPLPGRPDAPRVALIINGLGISANETVAAIANLPGTVTLGFVPYGTDVKSLVGRARAAGHEVLLQVPMEPFQYPDNDPGPQTLLTSLTPQQNIERLHWLMSRFQGYVGLSNTMGARFTASEPSFAPIMRETAKRGLIFVDDGSNQ